MSFDNFSTDGQAQAAAAATVTGLAMDKFIKDPGLQVKGDALAVISNGDEHPCVSPG